MKILTCVPYAEDKQLGRAYNEVMDSLPEGGWACLIDHDVLFTTRDWYRQLLNAAVMEPKGTFTCATNRIGPSAWQLVPRLDRNNHDVRFHRALGQQMARDKPNELRNVTHETDLCRGLLILMSKETWRAIGGFGDGMLGVDFDMHLRLRKAGLTLYLIEGLYLYHWYRGDGKDHPPDTPRLEQPR